MTNNLQTIQGGVIKQEINTELYTQFINYIDVKKKTLETYNKALRQFFKYLFVNDIRQPQREDIINYREDLKSSDHKATTIQTYITVVRLFFKWTSQAGIYPNVAENIKGAKISKAHKKDYLTSNQLSEILEGIERDTEKGARDYAAIALMATCGLRTIELERANIEDLRTAGNGVVLDVQGKGHDSKDAFVNVSEDVEKAIRHYLKFRGKTDGTAPLFASTSRNNKGARVTTRAIRGMVKERFRAAGYDSDRLTAHSLRHTAVTLSLLGGEKLENVQEMARHEDINTTMIYNHALDMAKNTCSQTISNMIFKKSAIAL